MVSYQKIAVFIFLIMLVIPINAVEIQDYNVTNPIHLNEFAKVTGRFFSDLNTFDANVQCRTIIYDVNSPVAMFTDVFTDTSGRFYQELRVIEPDLLREESYTIQSSCGGALNSADINILNLRGVSHSFQQTWSYIFTEENVDVTFFLIIIFAFILFLFLLVVKAKQQGKELGGKLKSGFFGRF